MKKFMSYKENAQITIETALIVPVVMLVVAGLIYMTLFVHDVIALRSEAYSIGIEYAFSTDKEKGTISARLREIPLFVVKTKVDFIEEIENYVIKIEISGKGMVTFINKIINNNEIQKVYIPKRMSREVLYGSNALVGELEERKGDR